MKGKVPAGNDTQGSTNPMRPDSFSANKINEYAAQDAEGIAHRKGKATARDFYEGSQIFERARAIFHETMDNFQSDVDKLNETSKKAQGKMRMAIDKTSVAFQKINQNHPIEKIERQAKALTEMADALERIASLKESGKLDKIIEAVR